MCFRCGDCNRFMKLITTRPVRLYCPTCNMTQSLPSNGTFRTHKEMRCPLDNFDLLYFNGGVEGKSYVLCPNCYNNPPFENMPKMAGCNSCTNQECNISMVNNVLINCPDCRGNGVMSPDLGSGPPSKWRIRCNKCVFMFEGFAGAPRLTIDKEKCAKCQASVIAVTLKDELTGEKTIKGCMFCHEALAPLFQARMGAKRVNYR